MHLILRAALLSGLISIYLCIPTGGSGWLSYDTWGPWSACTPTDSCNGLHSRRRDCVDANNTVLSNQECIDNGYKNLRQDNRSCIHNVLDVNGVWSTWASWSTCSVTCHIGTRARSRTCDSPIPCNSGLPCPGSGTDNEACDTGVRIDGEWTEWSVYSSCSVTMGHGVRVRSRTCTDPPTCGGNPCEGDGTESIPCEIIPDCFSGSVFGKDNRNISDPMVFYTSARVDIISKTQILSKRNNCETIDNTVFNYWSLYLINTTINNESLYMDSGRSRFQLIPGEIISGLYRLHFKKSYSYFSQYFVEGSMYLEAIYPPPNAFIIGGSGRLVGPGIISFDANTGSYDLIQGPGHSDNLTFSWSCIEYPSVSLNAIIDVVFSPTYLYTDTPYESKINWTLLDNIYNVSRWTASSTLFDSVKQLNSSLLSFDYDVLNYHNITHPYNECSTLNLSLYSPGVGSAIVDSCSIVDFLMSLVWDWTEYEDFLDTVIDVITATAVQELGESISVTYNEINSASFLIQNSTNVSEWQSMIYPWLNETTSLISIVEALQPVLEELEAIVNRDISSISLPLHEHLSIAQSRKNNLTIISQLLAFSGAIDVFQNYDYSSMRADEYSLVYGIREAYEDAACSNFTVTGHGYGGIYAPEAEVQNGIGYIITVRVNKQGSVSYFQQRVQTEMPSVSAPGHSSNGGIPELLIQCKLNCMQKIAPTSVISLRAECLSCTYADLLTASYVWDIEKFDPYKRTKTAIPNWKTWLETEENDAGFVIRAGSFESAASYIVKVDLLLQTGQNSTSILMVETTNPPYGGYCRVSKHKGDRFDLIVDQWKDEGFRSARNPSLDWKEQLSIRVSQRDKRTNATTLLYHGTERNLEDVYVIYGYPEHNYNISLFVQIFDIFSDYAECQFKSQKVEPPIQTGYVVENYIEDSIKVIESALSAGDSKLVSMTVETAATTVTRSEIPQSFITTDASQWQNIGVAQTENETLVYSFEDILASYINSTTDPLKENLTQAISTYSDVMMQMVDQITLDDVVSLGQAAHSAGTTLENKDLVDDAALINCMESSDNIISYFVNTTKASEFPVYEDFHSTSEAIVRTFDNALKALLPTLNSDFPQNTDVYSIQEHLAIQDQFSSSSSDLTEMERSYFASLSAQQTLAEYNTSKSLAATAIPKMQSSIRNLGSVVTEMCRLKQLPVFVETEGLNTSSMRIDKIKLGNEDIVRNDVSMKFSPPPSQFNTEHDIQITLYDKDPFIWDEYSRRIASPTLTISITNTTGSNTIDEAIMPVKMKFNTVGKGDPKPVYLAIPSDDSDSNQVFFYKSYWKTPEDDMIFSAQAVNHGLIHHVYLRQNVGPTSEEYDWTKTVSPDEWVGSEFFVRIPGGLYSKPCVAYIAVNAVSGSNGTVSSRRKRSAPSNTTVNVVQYSVSSWTTGCRVWDDANNQWDTSSCTLSSETTSLETVCDCPNPPGNNFATTFYVPPNTIDFDSVFNKFDIINNGAVFGTVIAIIGLYVICAIFARRQDKKDVEKWSVMYLNDNLKIDDYMYILTVYTGLSRNSGTTSNISFVLTSDKLDTGVRRLEGSKKGFQTGSVERLVMTVPKCLGDLSFLNIWHDNSGKGDDASWFLNKIVINDVQTGDSFTFLCNEWLSVDDVDGKIQRVLDRSDEAALNSFGFNFQENQRENITENHLWLSVVMRPEKSKFTRVQRLSCCLALLFLAMISNAMFFRQDNAISQISIGPVKLSLAVLYISLMSICITTPPLLLITIFFKKSKPAGTENVSEESEDPKKKKSCELPRCFYYIAWILVALSVLVSGFFVILYSMEWGKHKSEEWLKCFFLSFFESVCLVDPIKVLALTVLLSLCLKKTKSEWDSGMFDRDKLLQETKEHGTTSIRDSIEIPYNNFPLDTATINSLKSHRRDEMRTKRILVELILYMMLLVVLYVISFSIRDTQSYALKNTVEKHLTSSTNKNVSVDTIRFLKVISVDDFYEWIKDTLLPYSFSTTLYNGDLRNRFDRMFVLDRDNFRIGPLRLRQLRSKEVKCQVPILEDVVCFDRYTMATEDTDSYCIGWNDSFCSNPTNELRHSTDAWRYTSSKEFLGFPSSGSWATYGSGGYMADLGVNYQISNLVVDELMQNSWIDRQTRAVFTEFTLYNGNANLFTHVSLLAEFPEFGGVLTSSSIRTFRLYQHAGDTGVFVFICELIFVFAIMVFAIKLAIDVVRNKNLFFANLWCLFDLTIVVITIAGIAIYVVRLVLTNATIDTFLANKHKFVHFGHIATWDEILNALVASVVFLTTIRIMRVLSYSDRLTQLAAVLSHGGRDLLGVFVMFIIVFFAYVAFGYLIFGKTLSTYRNLLACMTTISNALIGRNNINGLMDTSPGLAQIYYFTFVFFVLWILMTMLNAALNKSIAHVKHEIQQKAPQYGITDLIGQYYKDFYKQLLFLPQKRPSSEKRPPTSLTVQDIDVNVHQTKSEC